MRGYVHQARTFPYLLIMAALMLTFSSVGICEEEYTVGTGDTLRINVYGHPDLSQTLKVSDEGTIGFPLIGQFEAKGLSVSEISSAIQEKLGAGYIINPQVSVVVQDYGSRKAGILGKVKEPGLYELKGRTTLLELISIAGGLAPDAGQYAYITRHETENRNSINGRQEVIRIDLKKLVEEGDITQNILIRNDDSIFICKMEKVYVTGQVKSTGTYPYEEGLTVIKALTNAGGLTNLASANRIRIIRKENGEEQVLRKVKMDDLVEPEDVIVVPERFF